MAIADRYGGPSRNLGPSAMVDLLNGWFGTRYAMNQEAMKSTGEDPDRLAEMELEARDGLRRLNEALTRARSGDREATAGLAEEYLRQKGGITRENIKAQGAVARQKLWLQGMYRQTADREAETMAARAKYSDEGVEKISTLNGRMAGDPETVGRTLAAQVESLAQAEKAGGMGDPRYDAMVRDAYNTVRKSNPDAADAMARKLLRNVDVDPNEFFIAQHSPDTYDKIQGEARKAARGIGAGASPAEVDNWMETIAEEMGVDVGELLGTVGEIEEAGTREGGGGRAAPTSGRVGVTAKGDLSPNAVRALGGLDGSDPYAAIVKAIEAQADYADEIAERRKKALADRSSSRFPRANPYLANPNTYTDDRALDAVQIIGENDPGLNREWAGALRSQGTTRKAERYLAERGGVEPLYAAKTYLPHEVDTGGDLGGWLAVQLSPEPLEYWEESGWGYRVDPDLTITVTEAPAGHRAGAVVKVTDPKWAEMARNLNLKDEPMAMTAIKTLAAQPKEVRELFRGREPSDVTPGEVRSAYGRAMRRAGEDPTAMDELATGISSLPRDVRGPWSDKLDTVFADHARTAHAGGYRASQAARGSVGGLGLALEATEGAEGERRAEPKRTRKEAATERHDIGLATEGRDLALKAWTDAKDDAERKRVREGWTTAHEKAPSDLTKGALSALDEIDRKGVGAVEKQARGVIPLVKEGADRGVDVIKPGSTGTVRTPDMSREPSEVAGTVKGADLADFDAMLDGDVDFADFDTFMEGPK